MKSFAIPFKFSNPSWRIPCLSAVWTWHPVAMIRLLIVGPFRIDALRPIFTPPLPFPQEFPDFSDRFKCEFFHKQQCSGQCLSITLVWTVNISTATSHIAMKWCTDIYGQRMNPTDTSIGPPQPNQICCRGYRLNICSCTLCHILKAFQSLCLRGALGCWYYFHGGRQSVFPQWKCFETLSQ